MYHSAFCRTGSDDYYHLLRYGISLTVTFLYVVIHRP